jgi:hypothetical protein
MWTTDCWACLLSEIVPQAEILSSTRLQQNTNTTESTPISMLVVMELPGDVLPQLHF